MLQRTGKPMPHGHSVSSAKDLPPHTQVVGTHPIQVPAWPSIRPAAMDEFRENRREPLAHRDESQATRTADGARAGCCPPAQGSGGRDATPCAPTVLQKTAATPAPVPLERPASGRRSTDCQSVGGGNSTGVNGTIALRGTIRSPGSPSFATGHWALFMSGWIVFSRWPLFPCFVPRLSSAPRHPAPSHSVKLCGSR